MNEFDKGFTFYVGNMFGGKTAQLILDLKKAKKAGKKVQAFKLDRDNRYEEGYITAHNRLKFPALSVPDFKDLEKNLLKDVEVLGIEKLHSFDRRMIDFIKNYKNKMKIIGTALQFDYRGEPFKLRDFENKDLDSSYSVGNLMELACPVIHKLPVCTYEKNKKLCGREALFPQRLDADGSFSKYEDSTIVVGGTNTYFPRCEKHFVKPQRNL